jgi:hypothetical protein
VPLQMGAYAVFPPALSARASWGQYLRKHPTPALDTGRFSCDQTLRKVEAVTLTYRASFRKTMFGRLSYPAHFKKRGLRTAVYPA